jgi:hypothetical protein
MRRSLILACASAAAVVPFAGASAQITTIPSLSASVGGAYSTNPFLAIEGDDAASVQLDVRPSLQLIDGTDQAIVSAFYNRADYLTRYGSNSGYGAAINGTTRPNARTTLGFSASYDSQILGAQNGFVTPGNPILTSPIGGTTGGGSTVGGDGSSTPVVSTPVVTAPVLVPGLNGIDGDIGLIGFRQRRNAISAGVNASFAPDTRSSWNAGVNLNRSTYPNTRETSIFASGFTNYSGSIGYNRSLTELSSIGFQIGASHVEYDRGFESQIYTPRLTYNRTLSELWTLAAAVGAGITHDTGGTNVSVSVDGSLCRNGERLRGCLTGSRIPSVSGFGGVRVQTSVGGSFNYQVDQDTNASASGSYARISGTDSEFAPGLNIGGQNLVNADVSLQRRLGRMFSAVASVSYRNAGGIGASIPGDITGRLGLSVYLGPR